MGDGLGPQTCPHEDCGARYAAAVLEARDDWRCPECADPTAPCPVCGALVSLEQVWDWGECPDCGTHRLDLGDAWREKEREPGVAAS